MLPKKNIVCGRCCSRLSKPSPKLRPPDERLVVLYYTWYVVSGIYTAQMFRGNILVVNRTYYLSCHPTTCAQHGLLIVVYGTTHKIYTGMYVHLFLPTSLVPTRYLLWSPVSLIPYVSYFVCLIVIAQNPL